MIGIVVVSHSYALGEAAAQLGLEMVPEESRPSLRVASGLDEKTFGTDAVAIADAITGVDSGDGVLVLVDLGSAILSAEMALEFIDPEVAQRTVISAGPLVEGLVAAIVTASTDAALSEVAAEARNGGTAKAEQLGEPGGDTANGGVTGMGDIAGMGDRAGAGEASGSGKASSAVSGTTAPEAVSGTTGLTFSWTIRNPHGLHARPAAALVSGLRGIRANILVSNGTTGRGPVPAGSLTSIQALGLRKGDVLRASITGDEAQIAYDKLVELAQADFGEKADDRPRSDSLSAPPAPFSTSPAGPIASPAPLSSPAPLPDSPTILSAAHDGSTGSPTVSPSETQAARTGRQIAIGPARHQLSSPDIADYSAGDTPTEHERLDQAAETVTQTLRRLGQESGSDIYEVQEIILADAVPQIHEEIRPEQSAIQAVQSKFSALAAQLEELDDPYLRARAEDERGLQRLMVRALMGREVSPDVLSGILILDELDPATAGSIDPTLCQGIITTSGGATGHGAILAQARGLALITGKTEATYIPEGTQVAIDPVTNTLWIDPGPDQISSLMKLQHQRDIEAAEASKHAHDPACTRSGRRILVEANVSSVEDAQEASSSGADKCGLVRTEVLFGTWDHAPTAEEQASIFIQISQAMSGAMVTVRTWDPGGDKPLSFLPQDPEANPMLGERGIRAMRRLPDLLDTQLTAVLLAAQQIPVRVMVPMVTVPDEMVWVRAQLDRIRRTMGPAPHIDLGMMVETPSAALRACDFLDIADFISIGTNDLTQYTLAVDRGNPRVTDIAAGTNDAVWDLIGMAAQAFAGRPVAVCGDLASHPDAVPHLIALGVTELSVRPPLVGVIKQAVRSV